MISNNSHQDDYPGIRRVGNDIYFHCEITTRSALDLIEELRITCNEIKNTYQVGSSIELAPAWIHINSPGGNLFDAFAVGDIISDLSGEFTIFAAIEGLCASAATVIAMSCHEVYMSKNSLMLIHEPGYEISGWRYSDIKNDMDMMDIVMDMLLSFYGSKTELSKGQIVDILSKDSWFTSEKALELGLIDYIG